MMTGWKLYWGFEMTRRLTIYLDGASRPNPGPAAIGVVIEDEAGRVVNEISRAVGKTTNNRAEYLALIAGLEAATKLGAEEVGVRSDSQLLVRQINRQYRVRKAELKVLFERANQLLKGFRSFEIVHLPREQNKRADALAKRALRLTHD